MPSESTWLAAGIVLLRMSVAGTLWLLLGALLLLAIREPVRRVRVCGLILLGCLLIPLLALTIPGDLWGPADFVRVEIPDIDRNRRSAELSSADRRVSSQDPRFARPPVPNPPPEPIVFEHSLFFDEGAEGIPLSPSLPVVIAPVENQVARADRYSMTSLSPVEAAFSWWGILSATYFGGAASVAVWYIAGLSGLARVVHRSAACPLPLDSLWRSVRGEDLASTPLLVSRDLRQPIACWWRRSLVLLPVEWIDATHERIEAALAHEAEHVRRGDFWWWQTANLARIVFWFHPVAWWLRKELRIGQDFLADAAVVRSRRSNVDYAEFLTSSACRDLAHTSLVGLGLIGRRSELYRRVAMLLKREHPLELRSPRWWNAALLAGGVVALGAVTTMRVVAEPPSKTVPQFPLSRVPSPAPSPPAAATGGDVAATIPLSIEAEPSGTATGAAPLADPFAPALNPASDALPFRLSDGQNVLPATEPPPREILLYSTSRSGPGSPGVSPGRPAAPNDAAAMPPAASTVIRKLAIQNGTVEPEAGVAFSIFSLTDPAGVAWKPDGSRFEGEEGALGASPFGGGGMPGGYAGMAPPSGMPAPTGSSFPAETRQRTVALRVQRPLPVGLNLSVDGQSVSRASTALPDPKVRQITQTALWPDEQMEGSVGVRFASKTVVLELTASKREGETMTNKEGGLKATLGPWRQGGDLQTEIAMDGVQANDPRFVVVVQAVDVEGTTHPGRIEQRRRGPNSPYTGGHDFRGMGAGDGMAGMMRGLGAGSDEWLIVFPHLPADRIAKVRLTWHPYAWVIFRSISLEPDHKTTPTAELYVDPSKPEDRPEPGDGQTAAPLDVSTLRSI